MTHKCQINAETSNKEVQAKQGKKGNPEGGGRGVGQDNNNGDKTPNKHHHQTPLFPNTLYAQKAYFKNPFFEKRPGVLVGK